MNVPIERVIAVLAALAVFGIGYNALIERLEREVPDHGYTSFLVVGGVIATLAGAAFLIGLVDALLAGLCFVASGLPMIIGSVYRSIQRRSAERGRLARDVFEALRGES